ncbi:MAG: GNAT family N-acetyltransferase [Gammaproteobacteria bacterium]
MFLIRPARARDARAIAVMSRELIETGLGWSWTARRVAASISDRDTNVIVACDGSRVVAFAIMVYGEEIAHLALFAVALDCRRLGIGGALWHWLEVTCRVAGVRSVDLEVRIGNGAARRFYRALGFIEDETVPGYYGGVEAAVRMRRDLGTTAPARGA